MEKLKVFAKLDKETKNFNRFLIKDNETVGTIYIPKGKFDGVKEISIDICQMPDNS